MNGGSLPAGRAARWLASAWDQNAGLYIMSPVAAVLEEVSEAWLVILLGLPTGTAAGFVTGTSTATLCGLAAEGFSILNEVVFNQVLVGCGNPELTRKTLEHLQASGEC